MGALQGSSAEDIYTLAVNQRSFDPCLREFIGRHERLFVLTGAGCSTESGIPDYRDAEGAWKRAQPVNYRAFMADELTRRRYWARSMVGWPRFGRARPNAAHHALACLERSGRITRLVTQNVDGLHQAAGCKTVIDLHGRLDGVLCVRCELRTRRAALQRQLLRRNPEWHGLRAALGPDGDADLERLDFSAFDVPACERCGGILKPDVVFFGESVPQDRVRAAMNALEQADAVLIVGSSLMVYSGYRFAQRAFQAGKPVASVNLGRTRADDLIELKVPQACASALAFLLREELPTSAAAAAVD
ncbi:MAG TPA: NAD-dependent protein deacetylase [Steroidobacteraceae bacterium]|nr:NAD-dependent protein deacetylase [Steroidobacteraceae bacterium]